MNAVVLGAGAMGRVAIRDLVEFSDFTEVIVADVDLSRAESVVAEVGQPVSGRADPPRLRAAQVDAQQEDDLVAMLRGAEVLCNASQHYFNLHAMRACLKAQTHYTDLGGLFWMTLEQLKLGEDFERAGLTAVLGMGSTPGITNVMARRGADQLDRVDSITFRSGGRDLAASGFQPPYSIHTILDELTEPAMVFDDGSLSEVQPLSGRETIDFGPPVGEVDSIYTLHSELASVPEAFAAKGVRHVSFKVGFPTDFFEKLLFLVEIGFGRKESIEVAGMTVNPRSVLATVLAQGADGATVQDWDSLRVTISGTRDGSRRKVIFKTMSGPNAEWGEGGGSIQTATPLSIAGQMLAKGTIRRPGVHAPENAVDPPAFFRELARRGVAVDEVHQDDDVPV